MSAALDVAFDVRERRGRAARRFWVNLALLAPGCGFLFIAMALPIAQLAFASVGLFGIGAAGHFTLANYATIFGGVLFRAAFVFSFKIALVTAFFSIVFAVIMTALLQIEFPGRRLISVLYKIPLVVPSLVAAFLVLTMIGPGGMVARLLSPIGVQWPSFLHDPSGFGIILVLLWHNVPITILIVSAVAAGIPRDIVEAARTLGASPLTVFRRIIVPLCVPGISAAALIVFIDAFGTFAIPSLIGPAFPRTMSVMMTQEFLLHARWGTASALGVVMIATTGLVLVLYHRLLARMQNQQGDA